MERTEQYIDSLLNTIRTSLPNFAKQTLSDALKDQAADAQATIAALQARVRELEDDRSAWKEIAQDWSAAAKLAEQPEKFYEGYSAAVMNAMQALLTKARAELTQRTAERDTARRRVDELEAREVDVVLLRDDLEQRTAELEAAKRERDKIVEARQNMLQSMANWLAQLKPTHHPLYRKGVEEVIAAAFNGYRTDKGQPVLLSEWQEQQIRLANLQAELARVRDQYADLRKMVLALPKVEAVPMTDAGVDEGENDPNNPKKEM